MSDSLAERLRALAEHQDAVGGATIDTLQARLTAAEAVLTRLHTYFSDPRHERPEFKRLIETVLPK